MAVVKCKAGHYYDDTKYSTCPHCEKGLTSFRKENFVDDLSEEKTVGIVFNEQVKLDEDDNEMTIGAYSTLSGKKFPVGWLVATSGPEKGRDYRLYPGWNKIGRSLENDIYLGSDRRISREDIVAIIYEPKESVFFFRGCVGSELYRKGEKCFSDRLETGDVIEIGESSLVFIPFCTEERKW